MKQQLELSRVWFISQDENLHGYLLYQSCTYLWDGTISTAYLDLAKSIARFASLCTCAAGAGGIRHNKADQRRWEEENSTSGSVKTLARVCCHFAHPDFKKISVLCQPTPHYCQNILLKRSSEQNYTTLQDLAEPPVGWRLC